MNDYGPSNNEQYSNSLVLIDNFSKCVWTIPLKNKKDQTITDVFPENIKISKRKHNTLETDN